MKKKYIGIIIIVLISLFLFLLILFLHRKLFNLINYGDNSYYSFYSVSNNSLIIDDTNILEKEYTTSINHLVKYSNQSFSSKKDAIALIENNSLEQEEKCNNNLKDLENNLKEITGIYGINFCEISFDNAKRISDAIKNIYDSYPFIKEYVTNITIVNDGGINSYIAAFKPAFTYATSNTTDKFPFVIKIQVFLNASYYLNDIYLNSVIKNASNSHYFPLDATEESIIAHEFGHVITYVLAIKYYNSINTLLISKDDFNAYANTLKNYTTSTFSKRIIDEAYKNYVEKYGKISEENFRNNISAYADSIDDQGAIIYNETIAEAFHDYFLHRQNAKNESLEIMKVLNKYIKNYI